ncbi:MAG: NAD(P)-dependent oxidoreductase [Gammaproteobacteria bacterium]|nr:NAD(P)-dependent oxidoreductase [Gammaproteobacteria bacterium]
MTDTVGVIGLGQMGSAMAQTLRREGFTLLCHDLNEQALHEARGLGCMIATGVGQIGEECQRILLSLPSGAVVRTVLFDGDQALLASARGDQVVVDTSTLAPDDAREFATRLATRNVAYLDAPVSGGRVGALNGTLAMMVGGAADTIERVRPLLDALVARLTHVGDSGAGQVAKLANNLLCAAHLLTTSEALKMAERAGVDPERVLTAVNGGSGASSVSQNAYPAWILSGSYDSGFSAGLMRKDVALAAALIESLGLELPLSEQTTRRWRQSVTRLADADDFVAITRFAGEGFD